MYACLSNVSSCLDFSVDPEVDKMEKAEKDSCIET